MTFEEWFRSLPETMQHDLIRFPAFVMDKFREAFENYQQAKKVYRPRDTK